MSQNLARRLAERQNHCHETSGPWPKIPKLEYDCLWEDPIPESTSFLPLCWLRSLQCCRHYSSCLRQSLDSHGYEHRGCRRNLCSNFSGSGLTWKRSIDVGEGAIDARLYRASWGDTVQQFGC